VFPGCQITGNFGADRLNHIVKTFSASIQTNSTGKLRGKQQPRFSQNIQCGIAHPGPSIENTAFIIFENQPINALWDLTHCPWFYFFIEKNTEEWFAKCSTSERVTGGRHLLKTTAKVLRGKIIMSG
jgi:hypothetical protein